MLLDYVCVSVPCAGGSHDSISVLPARNIFVNNVSMVSNVSVVNNAWYLNKKKHTKKYICFTLVLNENISVMENLWQ